jgi:hypothetical protein
MRRARDLGSQIARAVIVDTSASMSRAAADGGTAMDAARREGRRRGRGGDRRARGRDAGAG